MISQVIFIADFAVKDVTTWPLIENSCYSLAINPSVRQEIGDAYQLIQNAESLFFSLTLKVHEALSPEIISSITAFLFLPAYCRLNGRLVINVLGKSAEQLDCTAAALSGYLLQQGIKNAFVQKLLQGNSPANEFPFFGEDGEWTNDHLNRLQSGETIDKPVYCFARSFAGLKTAIKNLQMAEEAFKLKSPVVFELIRRNLEFQYKTDELKRKVVCLHQELNNQKEHNEILRSGHSAKQLQLYYNSEYEILPLWYKRFGHILKVLLGKRTFKSLYRDDVKKHKP